VQFVVFWVDTAIPVQVHPRCRPPAVALGGRGSAGPGVLLPGRRGRSGWSAGRKALQPGDCSGDAGGPGPAPGEAQPQAPTAGGQAADHGEQAQPEPFGLPPAGGAGQGEHLGPGQPGANLGAHWARAEHSLRAQNSRLLLRPNSPPYRRDCARGDTGVS